MHRISKDGIRKKDVLHHAANGENMNGVEVILGELA